MKALCSITAMAGFVDQTTAYVPGGIIAGSDNACFIDFNNDGYLDFNNDPTWFQQRSFRCFIKTDYEN
jgi:hypothetical protein